jgi:hypothetical protein
LPGHVPNAAAVVALLVEAAADVNAPFRGRHAETPLAALGEAPTSSASVGISERRSISR